MILAELPIQIVNAKESKFYEENGIDYDGTGKEVQSLINLEDMSYCYPQGEEATTIMFKAGHDIDILMSYIKFQDLLRKQGLL